MTFVFIHPPRTAGTSVRQQIGWGAIDRQKFDSGIKHAPYHYIAQHVNLDGVYKFATVRNPYARAVGLYGMWGQTKKPFAEWLEGLAERWDDLCGEPYNRYHYQIDGKRYHHAAPQMYFLGDTDNFDKLVRFENRNADLAEVAEAIGQPIDVNRHAKVRKDNSIPWRDWYNDHTRALVRRLYADDFRELGYQ